MENSGKRLITESEYETIRDLTDEQIENIYGCKLKDITVVPHGFKYNQETQQYVYYPLHTTVSVQRGAY